MVSRLLKLALALFKSRDLHFSDARRVSFASSCSRSLLSLFSRYAMNILVDCESVSDSASVRPFGEADLWYRGNGVSSCVVNGRSPEFWVQILSVVLLVPMGVTSCGTNGRPWGWRVCVAYVAGAAIPSSRWSS